MKRLNKRQKEFLKHVRERFVEERINGFLDKAGTRHAPVSMREAVRMWTAQKERFSKAVFDPDIIEKFQLDKEQPIPKELRKYAGPPIKKKPIKKEKDVPVIVVELTEAEAQDILYVIEKSLERQHIGPDYAERCGRIIDKLSRPAKTSKEAHNAGRRAAAPPHQERIR